MIGKTVKITISKDKNFGMPFNFENALYRVFQKA